MSDPADSPGSTRDPARRGRLGFSRATLSLVGVVIVLAFLVWIFLP